MASDSEYTSVKFGTSKFQKINKELELENKEYKKKNDELRLELDKLKDDYNKRVQEEQKSESISKTVEATLLELDDKYKMKSKEDSDVLKEKVEMISRLESENNELKELINKKGEEYKKEMEENKSTSEKYNELKERNIELKKLCDIKTTMNMNTNITIAELSSQINIKNEYLEKSKVEVNEAKRVMINYRSENASLRGKLEDKDAYIVKLNGEIGDLGYRLDNMGVRDSNASNASNSASASTPRVTTYKEPILLSTRNVEVPSTRSVQRERRV
jgi:chromosome segregation ATPase